MSVKNEPSADLTHGSAPQPTIDFDAIAGDLPMDESVSPTQHTAPAAQPAEGEEPPAEGEPAPKDGKQPNWMDKRFGELAQKSAELRKEREALKPVLDLSKALSPVQAAALQKALQSGNPMAAMTAMGFSYADIAASVAGGGANPPAKKPAEEPEEEAPTGPAGDPEWEEFKKERREQKVQAQRNGIVQGIKSHLAPLAAKFKHVNALEAYDGVMSILDEFFEAAGSLPSTSAAENIRIAAEELERRYTEGELPLTRKQWEKIQGLTAAPASASTQPEATRTRPGIAPGQRGSRTLTNNAGAPPSAPAATPIDPGKAISDLASDPNMPWS